MFTLFNVHFFFILMISCAKTAQKRQRNFIVNILKVHCDTLSPLVSSLDCFPLYNKNLSSVNVYLVPKEDFNTLTMHIKCTVLRHNQKNFDIIDVKIDTCDFLAHGPKRKSLLQVFANEFKTVGVNLEKGCPLKKNIKYGVKELTPDGSFFPPFSPDLNYTVVMKIYVGKEQIATFSLFASIFQKKKS